jgi:uncharacterized membrane protein
MRNDDDTFDIKKYTYTIYVLQAVSFIPFLFCVPAIIGVLINYIKGDDVKGSWLQSHFIWQKNTFWFGLLWLSLGMLTTTILIGYVVLFFVPIWLIYRIAKGWIYLVDGKELYLSQTNS